MEDLKPRKILSVFDAVMITVGIIIGGGIFSIPPLVAEMTGSVEWMFGAWLAGAALALIGALCYAELSTTFPNTGGEYHFLSLAYNIEVGFLYAWAKAFVITTGSIALLAFIFGDYLHRVFSVGHHSQLIYAALVVIALTGLNIAGLRLSSLSQNIISGLLIAGILLVIFAGFNFSAQDISRVSEVSGKSDLMFGTALLFVLFTFGGWNEAAYVSAEVKGGKLAIFRVLIFALVIVSLLYLLFIFALWSGLSFDGLKSSKQAAADVLYNAFGFYGEKLIGGIVAIAALSSINVTMLVTARTNYSIGRDWSIFSFMGNWNTNRDTPVTAFLITGFVSLVLIVIASIYKSGVKFMVEFTAPIFWFFFLLIGIALFILRFKYPHVERPFRVPLYPVLPLIFVSTSAFLLYKSLQYTLENGATQVALFVMLIGIVILAAVKIRGRQALK